MAEFKLPDMGEDIDEAEVLKVLVASGDRVEKDQAVLELETDKATFEVPSSVAGTVGEVQVGEGDRLRVGQTIFTVEEGGASEEEKQGAEGQDEKEAVKEQKEEKEEKKEKKETKREAERDEGEKDEGEPEDEVQEEQAPRKKRGREKAAMEKPAPGEEGSEEDEERGEASQRDRAASGKGEVAAGPATRRLARELGVDLAQVTGRSPGGRITADDVKAAARKGPKADGGDGEAPPLPDLEAFGPVERRRLSGIERAAVGHLSTSWRTIPHVTQHDQADVTELETLRRRFEERRRSSDPKITATALVVKAVVAALQAFPRVNASLDVESEELVLKRYCHVGVAVDTEEGLLVPVVRDADRKTTRQIASDIAGLAERARERKLTRDEIQGASFTVTNLGGIGGTSFTPIVSHPQVAILGVSRVREEPVVHEGEIAARLVMPLSFSYDHRAINGADAARFTRHVASLLEDPLRLLAES